MRNFEVTVVRLEDQKTVHVVVEEAIQVLSLVCQFVTDPRLMVFTTRSEEGTPATHRASLSAIADVQAELGI